jgi:hypothetical protein
MSFGVSDLVALIVAVCFAAGLNVYATVATLGLLSRAGWLVLPTPLGLLDNWWIIGICLGLWALEFVADKIPVVDLIWNGLATVVRVPAAGLLAYAAASPLSPVEQLGAAAAGAAIAFAAHSAKVALRASVTASPEPFSNVALSLAEDAVAIGLVWFATEHPWIAATIVLILIAMIVLLLRTIVRLIRRMAQPRPVERARV